SVLLTRRPPTLPLFPYTTLFRSPTAEEPSRLIDFRMPQGSLVGGTGQVGDRIQQNDEIAEQFTLWSQQGSTVSRGDILVVPIERSEEHTSELQSRENLVCRLLLE